MIKPFNNLSLNEQGEYVFQNGKFISNRFYYNYNIALYCVEDDFFEVFYFEPDNKIEKIERVKDLKVLDLYIISEEKLKEFDEDSSLKVWMIEQN
jgi:hypothetical protein